jgi:hypothetical protein
MRRRLALCCWTIGLALAATEAGAAPCELTRIEFRGRVVDYTNGAAVAGASAHLFLDDRQGTWAHGAETRSPDGFTTDESGALLASAYFTPSGGKRCDGTPRRVTLLVVRPGFLTKRIEFRWSQLTSTREATRTVVALPPIELSPSP